MSHPLYGNATGISSNLFNFPNLNSGKRTLPMSWHLRTAGIVPATPTSYCDTASLVAFWLIFIASSSLHLELILLELMVNHLYGFWTIICLVHCNLGWHSFVINMLNSCDVAEKLKKLWISAKYTNKLKYDFCMASQSNTEIQIQIWWLTFRA